MGDFSPGDEGFGLLPFPSLDGSAYAEYVAARTSLTGQRGSSNEHERAAE